MKKILITAALPYINNVPHMGHIVGSHLPADIFYRYCIQKGYEAVFIGGSDEHGTPSVIAARETNMNTDEFVNKLHFIHKEIYDKLEINYSIYSRTSSLNHHKIVKDFFKEVYKNGYISKEKVKMYYSEEDKMFLPDRFITGTCPKCKYEGANGDQCESCGYILTNSTELINPKSKISGSTPILKETEHLYFDLDKLSGKLEEWLETKKDILKSNVYAEGKKWIKDGLRKRSITRDMSWGIKVPLEGFEDKVFYVWFDAPIGYITFADEINKMDFWTKDTEIYHFLGKDNIPFHIVFWPAMLLANSKFNMPYYVAGYNYLNYEGQKFSKSKKIGVFCYNLLHSDIDIDSLRFYLTSVLPESKDSDFKWEAFRNTVNAELIGNIANFFNRTLNLIWKNFENSDQATFSYEGIYNEEDKPLLDALENYPKIIDELYEKVEIRNAQKKILELSSIGNKYIDTKAPWNLAKNGNIEELKKVLHLSINLVKTLSILIAPVIPKKIEKFWKEQLYLKGSPLDKNSYNFKIEKEHTIKKPSPLFQRIEEDYLKNLEKEFSAPFDM